MTIIKFKLLKIQISWHRSILTIIIAKVGRLNKIKVPQYKDLQPQEFPQLKDHQKEIRKDLKKQNLLEI